MLHELLLALDGHEGAIFSNAPNNSIDARADEGLGMRVNPALSLFHPAEVKIVNSLLEIGTEYSRLQKFIRRHRDHHHHHRHHDEPVPHPGRRAFHAPLEMAASLHAVGSSASDHHLSGLYVEALCHGLDLVLEPYREALVDVERTVLEKVEAGEVQVTHLQHKLKPFQPVLAALNRLVKQV
jgi:gamma-tubulin complex component 4